MASVEIREMTEGDLARLGLAAGERFWGRVGVRRGAIVGYGAVFWAPGDAALICYGAASTSVRPLWLAIEARRFLRDMPAEIERVKAFCDLTIPRAAEFLKWLGFSETDEVGAGWRAWTMERKP